AARSALCRAATAPIQTRAKAAVLDASRTIAIAQTVADPAWLRDGERSRSRLGVDWASFIIHRTSGPTLSAAQDVPGSQAIWACPVTWIAGSNALPMGRRTDTFTSTLPSTALTSAEAPAGPNRCTACVA